jgi:hypothetical protein
MSYKNQDYTEIVAKSTEWPKYSNAQAFDKVVKYLVDRQYIPSQVSLNRGIKELGLRRVDGGSIQSDARAAKAAAQAHFDSVVLEAQKSPLEPRELNEFGSLSARELSRRFFDENSDFFRIRYQKAMAEYGYREPQRFADEAQR